MAEADETIVIVFGSLPAGFVAGRTHDDGDDHGQRLPAASAPSAANRRRRWARSANRPPVVEAQIEGQRLDAGTVLELDISRSFYDRERRALTYSAESDDLAVVAVTVDQHGMLTLRGIARGVATVTVTVADHRDERVSQTFAVTVLGPATVWLFPCRLGPAAPGIRAGDQSFRRGGRRARRGHR